MKKTLIFTKRPKIFNAPYATKISLNTGELTDTKSNLPSLKTLGAADANLTKVETLSIDVKI